MDAEGTLGRGHINGGRGLRRQRSLEWRERRGYGGGLQSSSDEESNTRHGAGPNSVGARGARSPGQVFASFLAQQYSSTGDRSYCTGSDTEDVAKAENSTTAFPTSPPTLTPNQRQASPFPLESTNSRRHHYNGSAASERSRNGNGETVYAAPSKKANGGTLGRRTRRGHASALSSSSTASDRSETIFPDEHSRMHLNNDTGGDSPPEPAPEVPPRGPSLHATHTLRTQQNRNGCPPNASAGYGLSSDQVQSETYSDDRRETSNSPLLLSRSKRTEMMKFIHQIRDCSMLV